MYVQIHVQPRLVARPLAQRPAALAYEVGADHREDQVILSAGPRRAAGRERLPRHRPAQEGRTPTNVLWGQQHGDLRPREGHRDEDQEDRSGVDGQRDDADHAGHVTRRRPVHEPDRLSRHTRGDEQLGHGDPPAADPRKAREAPTPKLEPSRLPEAGAVIQAARGGHEGQRRCQQQRPDSGDDRHDEPAAVGAVGIGDDGQADNGGHRYRGRHDDQP